MKDAKNAQIVARASVVDMERMELLKKLQKQTQRTLTCNPGQHCWCAQLSFRFPLMQGMEECMSPKEMLECGGDEMSLDDKRYLERLVNRVLLVD